VWCRLTDKDGVVGKVLVDGGRHLVRVDGFAQLSDYARDILGWVFHRGDAS
jgi:hypothetical protein